MTIWRLPYEVKSLTEAVAFLHARTAVNESLDRCYKRISDEQIHCQSCTRKLAQGAVDVPTLGRRSNG